MDLEEQEQLKNMHLETLEIILEKFKDYESYLRTSKPKSEYISGLELSIQIIGDVIKDKKKMEGKS